MRRPLWVLIGFVGILLAALFVASPADAATDISVQGYRTGGGFSPTGDGGTIPSGAELDIRVWSDLYSCDPVTVDWGDGTVETLSYGGSFARTWLHTYAADGTYVIESSDPCGGVGDIATITVGGLGFGIFDPTGDLFLPTFLGFVLGIMALGLALGKAAVPKARRPGLLGPPAQAAPVPRPPARRRLEGIPASMVAHLVSLRDIPIGAPRQPQPRIEMVFGTPTDVGQRVTCTCGGRMGFTAAGWFCLDQGCPQRVPTPPGQLPRIVRGI